MLGKIIKICIYASSLISYFTLDLLRISKRGIYLCYFKL